MRLNKLNESLIGKGVRIPYTHIVGTLESFNVDYGDDVSIRVSGETFYLPGDFDIYEYDLDDYEPSVLLGVVDPQSEIP